MESEHRSLGIGHWTLILVSCVCFLSCAPPPPELSWHDEQGYRWAELPVSRRGATGFTQLGPEHTGIIAVNELSADRILENQLLMNGSGVALGDVDGDGLVDIYFSRLDSGNVLYKNLGGWRFRDITTDAGVAAPERFSTGAALADADGDRDLDLFVTALGGPNAFFVNDGKGVFTERTVEAGLVSDRGSTTMAFADVDRDGDLDLYVANYKTKSVRDLYPSDALAFDRTIEVVEGDTVVRGEFREHYGLIRRQGRLLRFEYAEPDRLYLNDGNGSFTDVTTEPGRFLDEFGNPLREPLREWALTARFYDVDGDGDQDLYVCNDFESPDRFWINDGTGHFRLVDSLALRTTSGATMGVDFADIDRDGDVDFLLLDMLDASSRRRKTQTFLNLPDPVGVGAIGSRTQLPRNTLHVNRGDNTFTEVAHLAGVEGSGWSWSVTFLDVDLDGYEDALITNGYAHDFLDLDTRARIQRTMSQTRSQLVLRDRTFLLRFPSLLLRNVIFRNNGDGTFEEAGEAWGFGPEEDITQGMATADLDGDGDVDVVGNRMGMPPAVYRNESPASRVTVRLRGRTPNTQGIGAKIRVLGGRAFEQQREVALGNYLSSAEPLYTFAADEGASVTIVVQWTSGLESMIERAQPNRIYEIHESGATQPPDRERPAESQPLFLDVTSRLGHRHVDTEFDDRARQPLLRHKLSQLGPGATWYDVDNDGDEDLLIASGKGGSLGYYRNDQGRFVPMRVRMSAAPYDQTTVLPIPDGQGGTQALVGQASYEAASPADARRVASVFRLHFGPADASFVDDVVQGESSSAGPLAVADYDLDGDLDLLVGGRVLPGRYPMATSSRLMRNDGGVFAIDDDNGQLLGGIGMVSSALFSDIDGDGDPDLLMALEWGPIKLFTNEAGRFVDQTASYGFADHLGLWNGITTGDLDGDGRLDVVATSWGRNTKLQADSLHPLRVYFGDFDGNGVLDIVDARFDPRIGDVAPLRSSIPLSIGIPAIGRAITSHSQYADASVYDIFGDAINTSSAVEATTLEHAVWFNRGDHFERVALPQIAQVAPAFYVGVADVDGDGAEDLVLTQNFSQTERETGPYNAGRGLVLRGDGAGVLTPLSGQASGFVVYGDQRGAAMADYDRDGRVDIIVTQNGAESRLLRNVGATPGVRIRLVDSPGNPHAIGAQVRLVYPTRRGPVREVHGGSGYWSMDGLAPVLGGLDGATAVWVRWPGGETAESPLEPGVREITIRH